MTEVDKFPEEPISLEDNFDVDMDEVDVTDTSSPVMESAASSPQVPVDEQDELREFVKGLVTAVITIPSTRSQQKAPGPSDLANKCDRCVARRIAEWLGLMTRVEERGDTGLKAWIGTAVHEKLERDLPKIYKRALLEIEVPIGDIPGIGMVKGHVDLTLPDKRSITDYKTADKKNLEKYKKGSSMAAFQPLLSPDERKELERLKLLDRSGSLSETDIHHLVGLMARSADHSGSLPVEYVGQTMLYLLGARNAGIDARYAVVVFIPRDSNYISDIWVASCSYREDVAQGVIRRASLLASIVREGRFDEVKAHPQCWTCVIQPSLNRRSRVK